jgi:Flp pilus assembly protein TadD
MAELARGSVGDRPWGRTLAALGLRAVSGQLTLLSEGKHFLVAFEHGAVVAAASPLASDAAVRVALTSHLVSSSQVPEISRRQAAAPERDEIDVIAELARLGPDHALRLRRRVIAQRAARTFSINHGEFLVTDDTELRVLRGCELDIRAIIYMGARANLPEQRLASELDQLGGWFRLKPALDDDLPQFGFTDLEQPVVERLRDGGTLAELEDFATSFVDARTVRAVVYALAAYNACDVGPAPPGTQHRRADASSPGLAATQPMPRITAPGAPLSVPRPLAQPTPRTVTPGERPRTVTPGPRPPTAPPGERPRTVTPGERPRTVTPGERARTVTPLAQPTVTPGERARTVTPAPRPRTVTPPVSAAGRAATGALPTEPLPPVPANAGGDGAALLLARAPTSLQQTERMTTFPDDAQPGESASARRVRPSSAAEQALAAARFDPPTQRDPLDGRGSPPTGSAAEWRRDSIDHTPSEPIVVREAPRPRRLSELAAPRDGSSPGLSRPIEPPRDRTTPNLDRALEAGRRERGSPGLARPLDDGRGPTPTLRFATDDGGAGSNPALRYPVDPPTRAGSTPRLRPTLDDAPGEPWDPGAGPADPPDDPQGDASLELPLAFEPPTHRDLAALGYAIEDDAAHISSAPPALDEPRRGSNPALRSPADEPRRGSNPALRPPDEPRRGGSSPALRPPADDARHGGSNPALRPPADEPRRGGSNPALRPPTDDARRGGSNPALRPPADDARRGGSSPALRPPPDGAGSGPPGAGSGPPGAGSGPPGAGSGPPGAGSGPPGAGSGPPGAGLLIRRVPSSRPPVARQVARTDSAHSHQVKALIAQRLTLLDKGADHFQLIGVAQDASPDALRKAYFALARQLHPDRLAALGISDDGKHAQRLFAQINAGFAILSEPARREPYVSILRRGGEAAIRAEQAKAEQLARHIVDAEDAFHRGELALRRDQPQAAVVELERAIQLNPEEADYHALLAWSQFCAAPDKMSVAAATRAALDRAILRSPRAVTARFYLGRVERMLGRDQDALRHFREVLEQAPHHAEAAAELRVIEARLSGGRKR